MKLIKSLLIGSCVLTLAACEGGTWEGGFPGGNSGDMTRDRGIDSKDLSQLQAGIWVDPNGCDHWIIDDGVEGYLSQRLDKYGKPVCSGAAPPTYATGDFKEGATAIIGDPI
ncbi:MAG: hypothetical protein MRY81_12535 [Donghicola eburneus]|jgi:hypothetical protein|nr:hypothetical protein [Donghicola eburneus]MCI5040497.1 hypothetical protein [Donghicola eburneus]